MPEFSENEIRAAFDDDSVLYFTSIDDLQAKLMSENWDKRNLLLMTSGDFGGMQVTGLIKKLKK